MILKYRFNLKASGIPDFRSNMGIYTQNEYAQKLDYPELIFDGDYFAKNPEPFSQLIKQVVPNELRVIH